MSKIRLGLISSFLLFLFACSSAKVRVMPGENGVNQAIAADVEKDDAEEAAYKGAKKYCKEHGKEAIFVSQGSEYKGQMDEGARKTLRGASRAASILGATTAGYAGQSATGDRDYESKVIFKCQ